jgi:putative ABC transport system permease protein
MEKNNTSTSNGDSRDGEDTSTVVNDNKNGLIVVTLPSLALTMLPLAIISVWLYYWMDLVHLSTNLLIGCLRTFLQLSLLGTLLRPIFLWGNCYLVLGYALCMILLASYEASSRTKYEFPGQFRSIFLSLVITVGWVSLYAFTVILNPQPRWNPRYVIPITGMLLGNSINGIALSVDALTRSLVEQHPEIELYLSFGASPYEAIHRILVDAIQAGTTPILNAMRVIGIIAIPGMMTGQILGGSPAMVAARYQMLIIYLIALCTLGVVLLNAWMAVHAGFDHPHNNDILVAPQRFTKSKRINTLGMMVWVLGSVASWGQQVILHPGSLGRNVTLAVGTPAVAPNVTTTIEDRLLVPPNGNLKIRSIKNNNKRSTPTTPRLVSKRFLFGRARRLGTREWSQWSWQIDTVTNGGGFESHGRGGRGWKSGLEGRRLLPPCLLGAVETSDSLRDTIESPHPGDATRFYRACHFFSVMETR